MKPRIIFIHGNGTSHWSVPWAVWLKKELETLTFPTFFETMPDSIIAREEYWLPFLKHYVKAGANDILMGWSSGGTASMRYAETTKIKGSILIAPSYTDLNNDFERQSGYYNTPWNWEQIKKNQEKITVVFGDNDPYISQPEFKTIAQNLNATKICIPNGGHFTDFTTFPQVLEYIKKNYI